MWNFGLVRVCFVQKECIRLHYIIFLCLTTWKLIKGREKKKVNACVAFHQMAEHGRNELQQLGSKKGGKQKQVVYAQQYYTDCR